MHATVHALSEEVKSINMKFDNFCSEASKRLSSLENKSISTDVKISPLEEKFVCVGRNFDFLNDKFDDLSKNLKLTLLH